MYYLIIVIVILISLHVSTLWGSSSGRATVITSIYHQNNGMDPLTFIKEITTAGYMEGRKNDSIYGGRHHKNRPVHRYMHRAAQKLAERHYLEPIPKL
jgi:hypothetical protein